MSSAVEDAAVGKSKAAGGDRLVPPGWRAPAEYKTITEGAATVVYGQHNEVFYNPVQVLNRDLSIAAIRAWDRQRRANASSKQIRREWVRRRRRGAARGETVDVSEADMASGLPNMEIVEALAASGLRSMRYAQEIPRVERIFVNDLVPQAVEHIAMNVGFNRLNPAVVTPFESDAIDLMHTLRHPDNRVDVVDLDPYGSPVPFIETAVQSVHDGGLLCVTATDMNVLAGSMQHACFAKYGAMPLKAPYFGEQALRLLLGTLQRAAARHKRVLRPLLCVSVDFYVRLFLEVKTVPLTAQHVGLHMGHVLQCSACPQWRLQPIGRATNLQSKSQKRRQRKKEKEDGGEAAEDTPPGDGVTPENKKKMQEEPRGMHPRRMEGLSQGWFDRSHPPATAGSASLWHDALPSHSRVVADTLSPASECPHCGGAWQLGGPLWMSPLQDPEFVRLVRDELAHLDHAGGFPMTSDDVRNGMKLASSDSDEEGPLATTTKPTGSRDERPLPPPTRLSLAGRAVTSFQSESALLARTWCADRVPGSNGDAGSNSDATVRKSRTRLRGLLDVLSTEVLDAPLLFEPAQLTGALKMDAMRHTVWMHAIANAGYRVSGAHTSSTALKTDAPFSLLWDIAAAWLQRNPATANPIPEGNSVTEGKRRTTKDVSFVSFEPNEAVEPMVASRKEGKRFMPNPGANWGPKSRAQGKSSRIEEEPEEAEDDSEGHRAAKRPRTEP